LLCHNCETVVIDKNSGIAAKHPRFSTDHSLCSTHAVVAGAHIAFGVDREAVEGDGEF
jgi:hypothetical protein